MENKKKYSGILMNIVASNKQLKKILCMENITVGIGDLIGGFLRGLLV